jgi:hypothetical protein
MSYIVTSKKTLQKLHRSLLERFGLLQCKAADGSGRPGWRHGANGKNLARLTEYKNLAPKWHEWKQVAGACAHYATAIFEQASASEQKRKKRRKSK